MEFLKNREKRAFFGTMSLLFPLVFAIGLLGSSCTGFFSTSLAAWAKRDPHSLIPPVNAGNIDELVNNLFIADDPDLSLALLENIDAAMDDASDEDKEILQNAALEVAVNASGLGLAAMGLLDDLDSVQDDPKSAIIDAINGADNLEASSELLCSILEGYDPYNENVSPEDLAYAAIVLLAAEAKKAENEPGGVDGYIDDFANRSPNPGAEQLAIDLATAALDGAGDTSGPLWDTLRDLGLI